MSHQKLKSIALKRFKTKGTMVHFREKSNNDTSPFKKGFCTIPDFVYSCWGGVYQHENPSINQIINQMRVELSVKGLDYDDLWFDFGIELQNNSTHVFKVEITQIFYRACDQVNNLRL